MASKDANEKLAAFFGKIPRDECTRVLSQSRKNGTYLIRVSTSDGNQGNYVLSLLHDNEPLHFQIKSQGGCWFRIDDGPFFQGLKNMLVHYNQSEDGLPTCLTGAVQKRTSGPSLGAGNSPMHDACFDGSTSKVSGFLGKGNQDVNAMNQMGRTPLHEACRSGKVSVVKTILQKAGSKLQLNATDKMQWTPMHVAVYHGHEEVTRQLLLAGASTSIATVDNETPKCLAARMGQAGCLKLVSTAQSGRRTEAELALANHEWWHGNIQRKVAEHILESLGSQNGLFLIRDSSQKSCDYVLSVCHDGQPYHFQIQLYSGGSQKECYFIDDGPIFQGLMQVVEYYRTKSDGLPTKLNNYVPIGQHIVQRLSDSGVVPKVIAREGAVPSRSRGATNGDESSSDDDDYNHAWSITTPATPAIIPASSLDTKGGRALGEGEFGAVLQGKWYRDGAHKKPIEVAIKTLRDAAVGQEDFLREASVMADLQHTYVVRLYGVCIEETKMIVQELVAMGALLHYLPKHEAKLRQNAQTSILFATQMACGMDYLEKKKFVHRDLATRNILVSDHTLVKISDFGLSRTIAQESDYYTASQGGKWPVKWYAPESVYYGKFTSQSDVWSFGVALWEIWTFGALPYGELTGREVLEQIEQNVRLDKPDGCPSNVYGTMMKCWAYEREARPTFLKLTKELKSFLTPDMAKHLK